MRFPRPPSQLPSRLAEQLPYPTTPLFVLSHPHGRAAVRPVETLVLSDPAPFSTSTLLLLSTLIPGITLIPSASVPLEQRSLYQCRDLSLSVADATVHPIKRAGIAVEVVVDGALSLIA